MAIDFPSLDEQAQLATLIEARTRLQKFEQTFDDLLKETEQKLEKTGESLDNFYIIMHKSSHGLELSSDEREEYEAHQSLYQPLIDLRAKGGEWEICKNHYAEIVKTLKQSQYPAVVNEAWYDVAQFIDNITVTVEGKWPSKIALHNMLYALSTGPVSQRGNSDFFANGEKCNHQMPGFFVTHDLVPAQGLNAVIWGKEGQTFSVLSEHGNAVLQRLNMLNGPSPWEIAHKPRPASAPAPETLA